MGGIPMRSAGISTSDRERTGIREGALFFRAGYAGCMECTVHLLAGMPVCYIYRIGDTILSWCEKGQKDDGGNEFRD